MNNKDIKVGDLVEFVDEDYQTNVPILGIVVGINYSMSLEYKYNLYRVKSLNYDQWINDFKFKDENSKTYINFLFSLEHNKDGIKGYNLKKL